MRAVQFDDYGPPEVLHLAETERPQPKPGQVLIEVQAIGVNPADHKWRAGMFRKIRPLQLPYIVGYDVAGMVAAIGDGVAAFKPGDRVVASVAHAYAEYAAAEPGSCARLPDDFGFSEAAALPCAALTGVQMVEDVIRPNANQTVLVTGATGAVGRFALYAACGLGAKVVAAVRPAYMDEALRLGAKAAIPLDGEVPKGMQFDHVADSVGGPGVAQLCRNVASSGSICTVSTTPIDAAGLPTTPKFYGYHHDGERLAQLVRDVKAGLVRMPIARRLPLTEAAEAHRLMEAGGLSGKIILEP